MKEQGPSHFQPYNHLVWPRRSLVPVFFCFLFFSLFFFFWFLSSVHPFGFACCHHLISCSSVSQSPSPTKTFRNLFAFLSKVQRLLLDSIVSHLCHLDSTLLVTGARCTFQLMNVFPSLFCLLRLRNRYLRPEPTRNLPYKIMANGLRSSCTFW